MSKLNILNLISRYFILILVALPNLYLFYLIFTPLTVYPIYFIFNLLFDATLHAGHIILVNNTMLEIIESCVAGSAYYLLLILNLATPKIKLKKRIKMISLAFASLLFLNILRIFILGLFALTNQTFFDLTHKFSWYFLSIIFVAGIWFAEVKIFKIKKIPFYSDIKSLYKIIRK